MGFSYKATFPQNGTSLTRIDVKRKKHATRKTGRGLAIRPKFLEDATRKTGSGFAICAEFLEHATRKPGRGSQFARNF